MALCSTTDLRPAGEHRPEETFNNTGICTGERKPPSWGFLLRITGKDCAVTEGIPFGSERSGHLEIPKIPPEPPGRWQRHWIPCGSLSPKHNTDCSRSQRWIQPQLYTSRKQKTANLQVRKWVGFLLPNKALSVESFLHWIKLENGRKMTEKIKKPTQPWGSIRSSLCPKPAASAAERTAGSDGDTLPPCARKAHRQPSQDRLFRCDVGWAQHSRHSHCNSAALQHLCSNYSLFPWGSEEIHGEIPCFYSSPLPRITNCLPTRRACCQVVPATAASSEQTAFWKHNK